MLFLLVSVNISAEEDSVKSTNDFLKMMETALVEVKNNLPNILVFTIDDKDSVFIETNSQFSKNLPENEKEAVKIINIKSVLSKFYSNVIYDTVILNVASDVKYERVYEVVREIDEFIDANINKDKWLDIKYKFLLIKQKKGSNLYRLTEN